MQAGAYVPSELADGKANNDWGVAVSPAALNPANPSFPW